MLRPHAFSWAAVAANGSSVFNARVLAALVVSKLNFFSIYDRIYRDFVRSVCGKPHPLNWSSVGRDHTFGVPSVTSSPYIVVLKAL